VAVNCAALPAELFESELFGSEPGAFTGATRRRAGRFERANSGTLFLDEIGEIPPTLQAKLLRALDTMTIERLGGDQPIRVDARLVAATNRDLRAAMAAGAFRQDLFYRLAVLPIAVPPLRERREDIPALAATFLAEARRQGGTRAARFAPGAADALAAHDYPGNVRELRNLVERLALLATAESIEAAEVRAVLPAAAAPPATAGGRAPAAAPPEASFSESRREAARAIVRRALERHRWNVTRAAQSLGLERSHLHRKMKGLGIEAPSD
jgi:transcriptional regulator with GAF, ATPase, and Fis domain